MTSLFILLYYNNNTNNSSNISGLDKWADKSSKRVTGLVYPDITYIQYFPFRPVSDADIQVLEKRLMQSMDMIVMKKKRYHRLTNIIYVAFCLYSIRESHFHFMENSIFIAEVVIIVKLTIMFFAIDLQYMGLAFGILSVYCAPVI